MLESMLAVFVTHPELFVMLAMVSKSLPPATGLKLRRKPKKVFAG